MAGRRLPDPLGLFGQKTDLLGKPTGLTAPTLAKALALQPETPVDAAKTAEAPVMPTPSDADVKRQKRRSVAQQRARSGRASTIFTEGYGLGG